MVKNPVKQETQEMSLIPGSGRHSREENSNPLQYFCLENPMDREAWWATVHGLQRVRHDLVTNNSNNLSFLLDCKLFVSAIKVPTIYLVLLDVCGMKE